MPFVSKVLKVNLIEMATRIMLGLPVERLDKSTFDLDCIGIKASQFSFARLLKADPVLGVEMASTGEVGCIGDDYYETLLKSMLSVGYRIPKSNILMSTGTMRDKVELLGPARLLVEKGYNIFGTRGTAKFLVENGVKATPLAWPDEDQHPNVLDYLKNRQIDLVINIPKNLSKNELNNDYTIRRGAVDFNIPLITNARLASAFLTAICKNSLEDFKIKSWDEY
jgi:carbamoyl-phosphate synthase large subunit